VVVAEAIKQKTLRDQEQVLDDCREALHILTHPMRKSRLLRLITDLSLTQLTSELEPLLQAETADERAAAVRALSRLGAEGSRQKIEPLLQDPVFEVRKAAQTALRFSAPKEPRGEWTAPARSADGTRSWIIGESAPASEIVSSDDDDWRARLRSF